VLVFLIAFYCLLKVFLEKLEKRVYFLLIALEILKAEAPHGKHTDVILLAPLENIADVPYANRVPLLLALSVLLAPSSVAIRNYRYVVWKLLKRDFSHD